MFVVKKKNHKQILLSLFCEHAEFMRMKGKSEKGHAY